MSKKPYAYCAWCLVLAGVAFGQMNPRPNLSNMTLDFSRARSLPYQNAGQVMFENVLVNGQPYALLAGWKNSKMEPHELRVLRTVEIPFANILLGNAGSWVGVPPVVVDPSGDQNQLYALVPGSDMANVYLARDQTYLYLRMTLHNGAAQQGGVYVYAVELQQYLYQENTPGDLVLLAQRLAGGEWVVFVSDHGLVPGIRFHNGLEWVVAGGGAVDWKVPLAELRYPPDVPLPYFPAGLVDRGIENRFVRAWVRVHIGTSTDPPGPVSDINEPMTRPLIVNFPRN